MKICRDVTIHGPLAAIAEARRRLNAFETTDDWELDKGAPQAVPSLDATVFKYRGHAESAALVWLIWEQDRAEVSNIVPCYAGALTEDQYNMIAERFAEQVLRVAVHGLPLRVTLGPTEEKLEDLLSADSLEALRSFSDTANRATGAAHPLDAERWHRFVIRTHIEGTSFDADTLRRWLHEDQGWGEDQAYELGIQYERARELLRQYDIEQQYH